MSVNVSSSSSSSIFLSNNALVKEKFSRLFRILLDAEIEPTETMAAALCIMRLALKGQVAVSEEEELDGYDKAYIMPGLYVTFSRKVYVHIKYEHSLSGMFCKDSLDPLLSRDEEDFDKEVLVSFVEFALEYIKSYNDLEDAVQYLYKFMNYTLLDQPDRSFVYDGTPREIREIFRSLNTQQGSYTAYNPFLGLGSLAEIVPNQCLLYGQDLDSCKIILSYFKCLDRRPGFEINHEDSVKNWLDQKVDLIITNPPFNMPLGSYGLSVNPNDYKTVEGWVLEKSLHSLTPQGQMICVVPGTTLYREMESAIRKQLVENNMLDTVILLPSGLFPGTMISTAIISIRNGREKGAPVKLVDATSFYHKYGTSTILDADSLIKSINSDDSDCVYNVSNEAIKANEFLLLPSRYALKPEAPEGYVVKQLGVLATIYPMNGDTFVNEGVMLPPISQSGIKISTLDMKESSIGKKVGLIESPTLLINLNTGFLVNVADVDPSRPLCVSSSAWVKCVVNEELIDLEYFIYSFTHIDKRTKDSFRAGVNLSRFTPDSLRHLPMCIITDIEMQKKTVIEASRLEILQKVKDSGLESLLRQKEDELEKLKSEFIEEVRNRKHDMKTPMNQLRISLQMLCEIVTGMPEEYATSIRKYLHKQEVALSSLSEIVTHLADEESFAEAEALEIEPILRGLETVTDKYVIDFHKDNDAFSENEIQSAIVKISRVDFMRLVNNIVSNAIIHGFKEENHDYTLNITLSIDKNQYVIDFSNNGSPLPEGMDKSRYGMRGVKGKGSDGSGRGGYIVKSICEHFGGDFDIVSTQFASICFTNIIVKLPIYRKDDEQV